MRRTNASPARRSSTAGAPPRIALYSHDALGLGHVRRNLAIAGALAASPLRPDVLLLSGTAEVGSFPRPPGCDVVSLPALRKHPDGRYTSRHLALPLAELTRLRSKVLLAALTGFAPDLVVVDRHPRGAFGELEAALDALRLRGRGRTVLGLRDVLDDPARARGEWRASDVPGALERWYDAVWVYGDPRVHDPVAGLRVPAALDGRVRHTGYLGRGEPRGEDRAGQRDGGLVLGLVGGGSDGGGLATAFAAAAMPDGVPGVLVLGPHMPELDRARVHALAAGRPDLRVADASCAIEAQLDRARAVVAMGGYNTVCEVIPRRVPLLVVPRVRPRAEQLVRAERMAARGLLEMLHPDRLTAAALGSWLGAAVTRPAVAGAGDVAFDGLARLPGLVAALLAEPPAARRPRSAGAGAPAATREADSVAV